MNIQDELEKIKKLAEYNSKTLDYSYLRNDHEKQRSEILSLHEQIASLQGQHRSDVEKLNKYKRNFSKLNMEHKKLTNDFETYKKDLPYIEIIKEVDVPTIQYIDKIKIEEKVIEIPRKKMQYLLDITKTLKWIILLLFVTILILLDIPGIFTNQLNSYANERNKRLKLNEQSYILEKEQQNYNSDLDTWKNDLNKVKSDISKEEQQIKENPEPNGWGGNYTTHQLNVRSDLEKNKDKLATLEGEMPDINDYKLK